MRNSIALLCVLSMAAGVASAQAQYADLNTNPLAAFKTVMAVNVLEPIAVPTVIEVVLPVTFSTSDSFYVLDNTTQLPVGYEYESNSLQSFTPFGVRTFDQSYGQLSDQDRTTVATFYTDTIPTETTLLLSAVSPIEADGISIELGPHVVPPLKVSVRALTTVPGGVVLGNALPFNNGVISFPSYTAQNWQVVITHTEPLQVREITFREKAVTESSVQTIRFLAQPNTQYTLYAHPDRDPDVVVPDSGYLYGDGEVLTIEPSQIGPNALFIPADRDEDGVYDRTDNCISVSNPDQVDRDGNGQGDLCDDFDRDGLQTYQDNCPDIPNRYQEDTDIDGVGDACDEEESRVTEQYPWLPWLGMGLSVSVIGWMYYTIMRRQVALKQEQGGELSS